MLYNTKRFHSKREQGDQVICVRGGSAGGFNRVVGYEKCWASGAARRARPPPRPHPSPPPTPPPTPPHTGAAAVTCRRRRHGCRLTMLTSTWSTWRLILLAGLLALLAFIPPASPLGGAAHPPPKKKQKYLGEAPIPPPPMEIAAFTTRNHCPSPAAHATTLSTTSKSDNSACQSSCASTQGCVAWCGGWCALAIDVDV